MQCILTHHRTNNPSILQYTGQFAMGLSVWTLQLLPSTMNSCDVLQNTWNMLPKPFKMYSTEIVANIFIDSCLLLNSQSLGHSSLKLFCINPNSELFPLFLLVSTMLCFAIRAQCSNLLPKIYLHLLYAIHGSFSHTRIDLNILFLKLQ